MANVNAIVKEIKDNEILSRTWRISSAGVSYAPTAGEIWRVDPAVPYGSPLGRQTAVKAEVSGVERAFWPSWLIKVFPIPQGKGSTKMSLKGHTLNGKEVSSISLDDLLETLSTKDLKLVSTEAVIGLKKVYEAGQCTGLREEIVNLYSWETVERESSKVK